MFADLGRRVFRFCIVYSIIASFVAGVLIAYGIKPPELLIYLPVSPEYLPRSGAEIKGSADLIWNIIFEGGRAVFINIPIGMLGGIFLLFYNLGCFIDRVIGSSGIFTSVLGFTGLLFQLSVYAYYLQVILKYFRGYGE